VDQNLRELFDRALDDEPVPPPGELARVAMADGARMRRRRRLIGGGATVASLAVAAVAAVHLATPPVAVPGIASPSCGPAGDRGTGVSVFLDQDVTEAERSAVRDALTRDERVSDVRYEGQDAAFERFEVLWRDVAPDFVASTDPESFPESFRVSLTEPVRYSAFQAEFGGLDGVADITGTAC
jgi:hypothetical protein